MPILRDKLPQPWISVAVIDDLPHHRTHAVIAALRARIIGATADLPEEARASVAAVQAGRHHVAVGRHEAPRKGALVCGKINCFPRYPSDTFMKPRTEAPLRPRSEANMKLVAVTCFPCAGVRRDGTNDRGRPLRDGLSLGSATHGVRQQFHCFRL